MSTAQRAVSEMSETIYTPDSHLGFRWSAWRRMFGEAISARGLTWRLFVRQISSRYRQSVLGYFWAVIPAILTVVTFTLLNRARVVDIGQTDIPYPAYVLLGMTVWQLFSNGISVAGQSLASARSMITKVRFPYESIVLSAFGQSVLDFLIRLVLVVAVFAWFGVVPARTVFLVPAVLLGLSLLTIGLGYLLAIANAIFRDVGHGVAVVMTFGMFVTPVVYPPPESWPMVLINYVNPVSPFVIATHDLTTKGYLTHPGALALGCVVAVLLFLIGWRTFHLAVPRIVERV